MRKRQNAAPSLSRGGVATKTRKTTLLPALRPFRLPTLFAKADVKRNCGNNKVQYIAGAIHCHDSKYRVSLEETDNGGKRIHDADYLEVQACVRPLPRLLRRTPGHP